MMLVVFIHSFFVGLNGAIDTLVSQAYGDKEYYLWGWYLNRGRIVMIAIFIPQTIFLLYTKEMLIYFGQDEEVSEVAQFYINMMLPGMFAFAQYETVRRYLQAMGIFTFCMYIQGISLVAHVIICYILTYTFELGIVGVSVATWISNFVNLAIVTLYISFKEDVVPKESWHFINSDSFKGFGEYLKFGVPSALIIILEWWSYELLAMYAGMLSVEELAAHVMLFNLSIILFQVTEGTAFVVWNFVGNSIGEMKAKKTKIYVKAAVIVILAITVVIVILLITFRHQIAITFTEEENVDRLMEEVIPIFLLWVFWDYPQCVVWGAIRGMGYQIYGSVVSFISYWAINFPLAYLLWFTFDMRLQGIWLGLQFGSAFAFFAYSGVVWFTDIDKLVTQVNERINQDKIELTELKDPK